jgi:exosortase
MQSPDNKSPRDVAPSEANATHDRASAFRGNPGVIVAWAVLGAALVWVYYEPISRLMVQWWGDADYQFAFLVPLFAGILLWLRRDLIDRDGMRGSWWGLALVIIGLALRTTGGLALLNKVEVFSLVPCLAGVVVLAGGRAAMQWAWPSLVFLVFMIPLPEALGGMLSHPLQRVGTMCSTYIIQTLGIPAIAHGNVIQLSNAQVGVVEACSGLRMMMLFVTVCAGAALAMRGSVLERLLVFLSAAPIAVLANIVRITVTSVLYETAGPELAEKFFHDLAGWFMMPLALLLLWVELAVFRRLFVEVPQGPAVLGVPASQDNAARMTKRRARPVPRANG